MVSEHKAPRRKMSILTHRTSDGNPSRQSSQSHQSNSSRVSATPSTHSAPRRRPSLAVRDSSQSTQSHTPASLFSRSSAASTSLTNHSRTASSAICSPPAPTSDRDSIISIVDDPFFQQYDPSFSPDEETLSPLDPDTSGDSSNEEISPARNVPTKQAFWPPPRRESLRVGPSNYWTLPQSPPTMESFNVAVIGATGVGKSSFIQRVFGLPRPPISNASTVRLVVDTVTHVVTLLELDLEYFELNPHLPIQWPKQVNGHIVPRVDAALILYDVMNQESIRELPQTVVALTNSGLPAVLVACKCEHPIEDWEVDAEGMANHEYFEACIATYKISSEKPEVARACLQTILRAAVVHRKEETGETGGTGESVPRRRAQSAAHIDVPESPGGRPLSDHTKHNRASSDLSLLRGFPNAPVTETYRAQSSRGARSGQQLNVVFEPPASSSGEQEYQESYSSMLRTQGIRLDKPGSESYLDIDESDGESRRYSDDVPILQRSDENLERHKVAGVSFDDLVERLIALKLSRADNNFSDVFLCLYRKFAAPGELFSATLTRLDRVRDDRSSHYLTKTATQLRIIEVIAKWVSIYPGDFARPATRKNLDDFIRHLATEPIFAIAAQQMRRNLNLNVFEDDDTGWAMADEADDQIASRILERELAGNTSSLASLGLEDAEERPRRGSEASSSIERSSNVGSQFQFHSFEEYEREAALLEPTDHLPMNKFRYHIFMDIPDDDIADELTRIDWIMFSAIRIRDFVRHVSLSADMKEKCKSLKNVNRYINYFNHVAQWVANMILLRDKAKHRAQIMEKFMYIALKLRQLNNYNGLAAVLAGINGTAIHRLAQTRALVPQDVQKRYARLVILMGTQKSHFAYRLAWENSPLPRIPFMPLHRRDLISAEEGSKTFVGTRGDRINWKKFEVLGEVLLPIMKSQGTPYPNLAKHDMARELIMGCRMPTDDEDIYQRSVQLESSSSAPVDPGKKKFPWFAK